MYNEPIEEEEKEAFKIEEIAEEKEAFKIEEILGSAKLENKVKELVNERISLAEKAEIEEEEEAEEEAPTKIGLFPLLLLGGVAVVAVGSYMLKNSSNTALQGTENQNEG